MKLIESIIERIVSWFFPLRCPVCDDILEPELLESGIHNPCRNKLYPVLGAVCMQCGRPLSNDISEFCHDCSRQHRQQHGYRPVRQGKALYVYRGVVKETMYRFKYSNKREYATFFAKEAVRQYGEWIQEKQIEIIVPVPMYMPKQKQRGYNQAESFARELSRRTGIPVNTNLVKRIKDTTPQKELNDLERKNNLKSAFQKCENIVQYTHILVVDDIYTTGSTAEAVAEVLVEAESVQVYFLSICIGRGM